jgi:predicted DNA-binding protein YlxM (UPF0122 family)
MSLQHIIESVSNSTILLQDIPAAKEALLNEIAACETVVQDPETQFHMREEYQSKLRLYTKLMHRL